MRIKEIIPTHQVSNPSIKIYVSDDGRAWTTFDTGNKPEQTPIGLLYAKSLSSQGDGYLTTTVRHRKYPVHRLVALAFVPVVEGKKLVNHIDGDKHNNASTNLEWVTHAENMAHAIAHGLIKTNRTEHHSRLRCERCGGARSLKFCTVDEGDRIIHYKAHGNFVWKQID